MHNKAEYQDRLSMIITYCHNPSSRFCCATNCCSSLLAAWLSSKWLVKVLSHFMMAKKTHITAHILPISSMIFNRFCICDLTNLSISISGHFRPSGSPAAVSGNSPCWKPWRRCRLLISWEPRPVARVSRRLVVEPPTPLKMVKINGYYMLFYG